MTRGNEPRDAAPGRQPAEVDRDELVKRVREELEAARRRVRDAWAQYQQRAAGDDRTREAIAASPLLTALIVLVQ
jgi:hypothetical protein